MPGFLSPRKGMPLLLIPEYSGINKGQRIPDRSKRAHRKPPVKCFLTYGNLNRICILLYVGKGEGNGNPLQYSYLENPRDGRLVGFCLCGHRVRHNWCDLAAAALCENCINLTVELVHSAIQIYYILLLFFLVILLIFENLILKLQLKTLIYLLKKIIPIHSGTIYKFVLYFPCCL